MKLVFIITGTGVGGAETMLHKVLTRLAPEFKPQVISLIPVGKIGDQLRLDAADILVLPSLQEGLPKATIEAMARGLPCIGSTVGGMPELVAPGSVTELAQTICEMASDPSRLTRTIWRKRTSTGKRS